MQNQGLTHPTIVHYDLAILAVILDEPERDRLIEMVSTINLIGPGSIPWEVGNAFSSVIRRKLISLEVAIEGIEIFKKGRLKMLVYNYSEARQKFSKLLEEAESNGKVLIRRKDGKMYAITPEISRTSPLDVPSIKTEIITEDIISIIRESRERAE